MIVFMVNYKKFFKQMAAYIDSVNGRLERRRKLYVL